MLINVGRENVSKRICTSSLHEMCDESGYVHEDRVSAVLVQHKSGKSVAGTQSQSGILTNTLCLYNTVSAV